MAERKMIMSTMTRLWKVNKGFNKGAKIMEHKFSDGSLHYTFRDKLGRPDNLDNYKQAMRVAKQFGMEEINL